MLSNSVSAAAAEGDKRSILWVARTSLLRTDIFDTDIFDTLRRASSMRFDGFVRVLRSFLTQTELFSLPITPQHVNPLLTFKFRAFRRLLLFWNFDFRDKIDRTGVDLEKYFENQKSGTAVVTSAALVRFRKI